MQAVYLWVVNHQVALYHATTSVRASVHQQTANADELRTGQRAVLDELRRQHVRRNRRSHSNRTSSHNPRKIFLRNDQALAISGVTPPDLSWR